MKILEIKIVKNIVQEIIIYIVIVDTVFIFHYSNPYYPVQMVGKKDIIKWLKNQIKCLGRTNREKKLTFRGEAGDTRILLLGTILFVGLIAFIIIGLKINGTI